MIEDKLNTEQRIRLEALAQAVASTAMFRAGPTEIIDRAEDFEEYIREGK